MADTWIYFNPYTARLSMEEGSEQDTSKAELMESSGKFPHRIWISSVLMVLNIDMEPSMPLDQSINSTTIRPRQDRNGGH